MQGSVTLNATVGVILLAGFAPSLDLQQRAERSGTATATSMLMCASSSSEIARSPGCFAQHCRQPPNAVGKPPVIAGRLRKPDEGFSGLPAILDWRSRRWIGIAGNPNQLGKGR